MKRMRFSTPFGDMTLAEENGALTSLSFQALSGPDSPTPLLKRGIRELDEYFAGKRTSFDLPLHLSGTPFQLAVWRALAEIPYGALETYGGLAARIGKPKAARAVGMGCHNNPLPIIIPCHRVVGHNGSLTGFGGGLGLKQALISLESAESGKALSR